MADLDMFLVEIDGLWVSPEDIIAIRANESGETSTIYCSDAHLFRVRAKPEEIVRLIEEAIRIATPTPAHAQPYPSYQSTFTNLQGVSYPSINSNPIVNP